MENKRGQLSDFVRDLLIGLAILVIVMIAIFFLKGTGFSLIDKIKGAIGLG